MALAPIGGEPEDHGGPTGTPALTPTRPCTWPGPGSPQLVRPRLSCSSKADRSAS